MPNNSLVQIAACRDVVMAGLVKSKLASEGIEAYLLNENLVTIDWTMSQAVGGVQVMVAHDDAERAAEDACSLPPNDILYKP